MNGILALFGELGGLYEFFHTFFVILLLGYPARAFAASALESTYLYADNNSEQFIRKKRLEGLIGIRDGINF